jgi:DNA-binding NarL/FixJ family response regulator
MEATTNKQMALFIDDDSVLVSILMDQLRHFFAERGLDFAVCTAIEEIPSTIGALSGKNVAIAIVDLWMIDKKTNKPNTQAGYEVINQLRKRWPNCYIVVLSGHIDDEAKKTLAEYKNIAMFEKPLPTFVLEELINNLLGDLGICRTSG